MSKNKDNKKAPEIQIFDYIIEIFVFPLFKIGLVVGFGVGILGTILYKVFVK